MSRVKVLEPGMFTGICCNGPVLLLVLAGSKLVTIGKKHFLHSLHLKLWVPVDGGRDHGEMR